MTTAMTHAGAPAIAAEWLERRLAACVSTLIIDCVNRRAGE